MRKLEKTITLRRGLGLAICMLIGTGILALPGLALDAGSAHEAILGWFLIALIAVPLIQICARLGLRFPSTAGLAGYAEEAAGPWGGYAVSYLVGGSFFFGLPAVALIGSEYMRQLFSLSELGAALFAVLLVTLMLISNLAGMRIISVINYTAMAVLFVLTGLLIAFNLDFFGSGLEVAGETISGGGNVDLKNVWTVAALLFWAFLGWENLSFSLGEIKDPEKNVPLLYWLSFALVTSIYILLALISTGASAAGVPLQGAAGLSGLVLFTPGGSLLIWLMVIVIAANACSWNFTASRMLYAGGRTGAFPGVFGKLSKRNIPVSSLVGLYVLSIFLILGTYLFKIPVSSMILLVNQNFIFLYAFIIIAYWKTETGWQKWVFSVLALLSLSFLVSGFTWKIIYPVFLIGFGYYRFLGRKSADKSATSRKELTVCEDAQDLSCLTRH
ncbi:APC family permease [Methanosarcina mazei]|uniref:Putrescine:ornithine antiporter n=1 Tax=Methanosarcina mazei TaxID=2209 RepID=A0A0F8BB64_METMZ|nr:amino acid permease [Methanosarcina mazei]KKF98415.1 putrescine:ornithine antiporter [Methanosarcina mazei]KKF99924.1 putrescine:ornithine antiporter [Methanosarcina mazei]KKG04158.1 putrescine:ornithine antiporter [Methanosarcina mazei]KKH40339.1 putrescine:ornithine antiporter [Methanosarcina mazei]KKH42708.1 putrescine:ornithine antiporter [Methanosarcina mazei]